jgi:hypothetical protein
MYFPINSMLKMTQFKKLGTVALTRVTDRQLLALTSVQVLYFST